MTRRTTGSGGSTAAGSTPRRSATRSWPSAATSTARPAGRIRSRRETWSFTQHNPFQAVYDTDRRSVYLMTQRIQRHPFLALFDGPDPNASTGRAERRRPCRSQALFLMNDPFVHEQAERFAGRLLAASATDDAGGSSLAYRLAFGRPADGRGARSRRSTTWPGAARAAATA